jgi:anthranilate/para-aminobenzoate synthase component I
MPAAPPFEVTLTRQPTAPRDPFATFVTLRERYGAHGCFLLESLAGPVADRSHAVVGFGTLLTVTVRGQQVEVAGADDLAARLVAHLVASGAVRRADDALTLATPDAFWDLQRAVRDAFAVTGAREDSYGFGAFAVYGYDAVRQIERLPFEIEPTEPFPELILLVPQASVTYDLHRGRAEIVVAECAAWPALDVADVAAAIEGPVVEGPVVEGPVVESPVVEAGAGSIEPSDNTEPPDLGVPEPTSIVDSTGYDDYAKAVDTALAHIVEGDIYQVQLGHEITIESDVDQLVVYQRLRRRNPSPYMCFVDLGDATLISASPELFLRISGEDMTMRPIAGTAPRTGDPDVDRGRVAALLADEKECAEHLMLVDLCRNDLGRVARIGTVEVDELIVVEDFSHVFHLVSNVVARKDDAYDAYDAIRATFPAGTMTGAPKVRAMEIIEHLETARRGGYAGTFGLLDFGGFVNTGLTIRSIFSTGRTYRLRASAGIVADSTPASEWRETLAKLSATYWAVTDQELLPR